MPNGLAGPAVTDRKFDFAWAGGWARGRGVYEYGGMPTLDARLCKRESVRDGPDVVAVVAQRTVHPAVRHLEAVCLADVATALRVEEPSAIIAACQ